MSDQAAGSVVPLTDKKQDAEGKQKEDELGIGNWLPLESNPGVLSAFARRTGLPKDWSFYDVYGLDDELLEFVPKPCAAVVLLFTVSKELRNFKQKQAEKIKEEKQTLSKSLFYITQHDGIGNACGTIATIHALTNAANYFTPQGAIGKFQKEWKGKSPAEIGHGLVKAKDIQEVSEAAASSEVAQTATPQRTDAVDAHFIAFIQSEGALYEMDGRKAFPINHGKTSNGTFLKDVAKVIQKNFFDVSPQSNFSLIALAKEPK
eukprot:gb/GEZN01012831.1/.p1 GENE.gb/GEZN01012831.1/~~gb/GEZN01012831.1/.p1  ORF type:complete len:262 (-),score=59.50 gb/GEZN01012831.1/:241-1026(-)